jgi:hypothetical protein
LRRKIAVVALGFGLAASFAPLSPASAVCVAAWEAVTGDCSPCDEIGNVIGKNLDCLA